MARKKHTPEQFIEEMREAEVLSANALTMPEIWKQIGVTDHTYYRRGKEYGGLRMDQAKRL